MSLLFTFTDFGPGRLYTGQLHAAIAAVAPACRVVELLDDAPGFDVGASAQLLAAVLPRLPDDAVVLAVVDPGVGGARRALAVRADERWLVGPDNGLFDAVKVYSRRFVAHEITWRPPALSATFHGRDLFAPVAALLATDPARFDGPTVDYRPRPAPAAGIIYVDGYGNCLTGVRAADCSASARLRLGPRTLPRLQRFEQGQAGVPFCYENSLGLLEIAVNRDSAARLLGLSVGDGVVIDLSPVA